MGESPKAYIRPKLKSIIVDNRKEKKKDRKSKKKKVVRKADSESKILPEPNLEGNKDSIISSRCLEDMEQSLLFEVSAKRERGTKDKPPKLQRTEPSLACATCEKEYAKWLTKFWQAPSPKKDYSDDRVSLQVLGELNSKDIPILYFQKKLNQKEDRKEEIEIEWLKKEENDNIEKLSEELSRVFDFDNEDLDNSSQKEEILKKALQLGGDNYTFTDLKRDLLSFEKEDKISKYLAIESRLEENEDIATETQKGITEQLLQEL